MSKESSTWHSARLGRAITVTRWGEVGTPVLFFPTAAADSEEGERFHIVDAVSDLLAARRIKLYSVDSTAGISWLTEDNSTQRGAEVQNRFDAAVYHEVVPAIRTDCNAGAAEIVTAGPSIGAFQAVAALCRHPDAFSHAICLSGTYDLTRRILQGPATPAYRECSPLDFVPELPEGPHLEALRERFVLIAHGTGRWEEPEQSWRLADTLGKRGIPNRVDEWEAKDHDWPTWREMLPKYLEELVREPGSE